MCVWSHNSHENQAVKSQGASVDLCGGEAYQGKGVKLFGDAPKKARGLIAAREASANDWIKGLNTYVNERFQQQLKL